jgi:hypothetical protein
MTEHFFDHDLLDLEKRITSANQDCDTVS